MTWIEEWKYYTQNQSFHRQKTKSNQDWQKSGFAWSSGLQNENTNWYVVCTNFMLFSSSKCFFLQFPLNWFRAIFVPFKGQRFRSFCSGVRLGILVYIQFKMPLLHIFIMNWKYYTHHCAMCSIYCRLHHVPLIFRDQNNYSRGFFELPWPFQAIFHRIFDELIFIHQNDG